MNRRGLWDKNSSLGPGHATYSQTSLQQAPNSRQESRNASPRETVCLPSVQLKFKSSIQPPPSPSVMLSASPPRQQESKTTRNGCVLPAGCNYTGYWIAAKANASKEFFVGADFSGNHEKYRPAEQMQPKEPRKQEQKPLKGTRKGVRKKQVLHMRAPTIVNQALPPLIQSSGGSFLKDSHVASLPLDCPCEHCGTPFNRLSIARHMKWCPLQPKHLQGKLQKELGSVNVGRDASASQGKPHGKVVARVITVGLVPGEYDQVLIHSNEEEHSSRPATRTLPHSTLHNAGHGLPMSNGKLNADSKPSTFEQCKNCGNIVSTDKLGIHQRLCQGYAPIVTTGTVKIPSTHNLLKVEQTLPDHLTSCKPTSVVCYICGQKYGTHSISIHEPQCLKKFNAQNDKLPISERLPLPKKRGSVARVLLREEEALIVAREPRREYMQDEVAPREELVQRYLESCYSEFEKELVPCKKCGRTFASARHRTHEPNCNAKPLKLL